MSVKNIHSSVIYFDKFSTIFIHYGTLLHVLTICRVKFVVKACKT